MSTTTATAFPVAFELPTRQAARVKTVRAPTQKQLEAAADRETKRVERDNKRAAKLEKESQAQLRKDEIAATKHQAVLDKIRRKEELAELKHSAML